jgi:S-adenosylmethionine uptake transporter
MFALAMLPWCYSLIKLPLPLVTTLGFTTPLFVTLLAGLILKETLTWPRLGATFLGFLGIACSVGFSFSGANMGVLLVILATVLFALLDIINKKLVSGPESRISVMLMPTIWSCMFIFPLALMSWQAPSGAELQSMFFLGIGSNLMFFCLLKAFSAYHVSALQPFKYSEFFFSCIASMIFFQEYPSKNLLWGLLFIVPSTLYLSFNEFKARDKV